MRDTGLTTLLALLRGQGSPADLPAGHGPMNRMLLAYAASNAAALALFISLAAALPTAVVSSALLALAAFGLLTLRGRQPRVPQTITALAGTGTLMNLALLPFYMVSLAAGSVGLLALAQFVAIGWSLTVVARIFREALEARQTHAFGFALGFHLFMLIGVSLLGPAQPAPPAPDDATAAAAVALHRPLLG